MAKTYSLYLLLIIACFSMSANGQTTPMVQPGAFKSMHSIPHRVEMRTDNAILQIICYSRSVVRVRISNTSFAPDFFYAVIQQPGSSFEKITKTPDSVLLETKEIQAPF